MVVRLRSVSTGQYVDGTGRGYDWGPGQIAMNDAVGGAIWGQDVMLGDWPDHSGLSLLGQFTVTDPASSGHDQCAGVDEGGPPWKWPRD